MKRTAALLGSAVMVAATLLATVPTAANAAPLTHDQQLALVPPAVTAAGLRDDQLSLWYLDAANTLHVGLTSYTPTQADALIRTLGPRTVISQEEMSEPAIGHAPKSSPVAQKLLSPSTAAPRSSDPTEGTPGSAGVPGGLTVGPYEPFLTVPTYPGGVRIIRDAGNEIVWCSTTSVWGGKMLTAGHCGANGAAWKQGYYDSGTIRASGPAGTASKVHWEDSNPDVALLGGGSGWDTGIYLSGDKGDVSYVSVAGAAVSAIGSSICTDGTTTGYVCGGKVDIVNGCTSQTEHGKVAHLCGMDSAYNATKILVRPGDSGGPVVTPPSGGKVVVAGDISGESDGGHRVWYSNVSRIKQILGVSATVG
jgi:hypothetical protein